MTSAHGHRPLLRLGIAVPSTNTTVETDFTAMHVPQVSHHVSRIHIPDMRVASDDDFARLMDLAQGATLDAIDRVMTCGPDRVVLGISAETIWNGKSGCDALRAELEARAKVPVTLGADACVEAIQCYGPIKKIAIVTPYTPVGDEKTKIFFEEMGFTVCRILGLKCTSPRQIADVQPDALVAALRQVDSDDVDCIVQFGTNLQFAELAAAAELWLGKPVIAVNAAIYRHALRHSGIDDRIGGYGSILGDH